MAEAQISVCRLCARLDYTIDGNSSVGKALDISNKVKVCLGINLTPYGAFSSDVCYSCSGKLNFCYEFYQSCAQSQVKIQQGEIGGLSRMNSVLRTTSGANLDRQDIKIFKIETLAEGKSAVAVSSVATEITDSDPEVLVVPSMSPNTAVSSSDQAVQPVPEPSAQTSVVANEDPLCAADSDIIFSNPDQISSTPTITTPQHPHTPTTSITKKKKISDKSNQLTITSPKSAPPNDETPPSSKKKDRKTVCMECGQWIRRSEMQEHEEKFHKK